MLRTFGNFWRFVRTPLKHVLIHSSVQKLTKWGQNKSLETTLLTKSCNLTSLLSTYKINYLFNWLRKKVQISGTFIIIALSDPHIKEVSKEKKSKNIKLPNGSNGARIAQLVEYRLGTGEQR